MRVVAIINQKGGCGKTTTAINLSACLAMGGRKILLVDLDPQAHATMGLNASRHAAAVDLRTALLELYEKPMEISQLKIPVQENLDMIPSLLSLVALEQELIGAMNRENRLRDLLCHARDAYDYVFIDAPPNLGVLTINALIAGQDLLIPVETGIFSIYGLRRLFQVVDLVRERSDVTQRIHILLTLVNAKTRVAREIFSELQEHFKDRLLRTQIRQNIHLKEAASYGLPIARFQKNSLGCWDYQALAEEFISMEEGETTLCQEKNEQIHTGMAGHEGMRPPVRSGEVLFSMMAPKARSIYLAGDFNNWQIDPSGILHKDEEGVWKKQIRLPPGTYQYKFYVDGQWIADPESPFQIVSKNGIVNSMVKVT